MEAILLNRLDILLEDEDEDEDDIGEVVENVLEHSDFSEDMFDPETLSKIKKWPDKIKSSILFYAIQFSRICGYLTELDRIHQKIDFKEDTDYPLDLSCGIKISSPVKFKSIIWSSIDSTHQITYYLKNRRLINGSKLLSSGNICGTEIFGSKDYPSGYSISLDNIDPREMYVSEYPYWNLTTIAKHLGFSVVCKYFNIKSGIRIREDI
jgi:hypothetical protein